MKLRRLVLAPEHRRLLEAAARKAVPEECCGILLGSAAERRVTEVIETGNVAARDRRSGYEIAPSELVAAWRRARSTGESILGFYHSHPQGRGRPSSDDTRNAWVGMSYVIVALRDEACELTSWRRERDVARCGQSLEREALCFARARESAAWH